MARTKGTSNPPRRKSRRRSRNSEDFYFPGTCHGWSMKDIRAAADKVQLPRRNEYTSPDALCLALWLQRMGDPNPEVFNEADRIRAERLLYEHLGSPRKVAFCHGHIHEELKGGFILVDQSAHSEPDIVEDMHHMIWDILKPNTMKIIYIIHCPLDLPMKPETFQRLYALLKPGGQLRFHYPEPNFPETGKHHWFYTMVKHYGCVTKDGLTPGQYMEVYAQCQQLPRAKVTLKKTKVVTNSQAHQLDIVITRQKA